jgi:hypothetical protein
VDRNSVTYLATRMSLEYGVPFQSIVQLSPMEFQYHVQVLKDLAKAREDASKAARRGRP